MMTSVLLMLTVMLKATNHVILVDVLTFLIDILNVSRYKNYPVMRLKRWPLQRTTVWFPEFTFG